MEQLAQWIPAHQLPLAIFLGVLAGGEVAVLAGLLLALSGALSVSTLFLLAFAANVASDLLWFLSGERLVALARRRRSLAARLDRAMETVARVDSGRRCRYLLYYKFVYGIRIATIVFTAMRRVSLRRFVAWNSAGSAIYLAALIGGGLLLLRGAVEAAPAAHALRYALAAAVAAVVLARWGSAWLRHRIDAR
jgi:membrane protein DedA with SNARE-associated domain